MPPLLHLDLDRLDFENPLLKLDEIRNVNPQRYEMEQLTAVLYADDANLIFAGYKDLAEDEFWIRGHMPNYPLMPGVLMCEAAAQLCSWYMSTRKILGEGSFIGLGGLENVKFRAAVHPGDRLVLIGKVIKPHRRQASCNVQGIVNGTMVFHGDILGIPLKQQPGVS